MRVILSVKKQQYLKNIADFRRKKQRNWRIHTLKWQIHPQDDSFTPILVIFHPQGSAYLREGEDFVAPATCLSPAEHPQGQAFCLHPHPSGYRSLLNTYFYKEILKSCIEIHPICFKFDSISNHNEWYLQGFRYNSHFLFQISRSQAAEGRLRGREG